MTAIEKTPSTGVAAATAVAVGGGWVLGVATAYGQFWLPERLGSLANSSGSWCAIAFGLALLAPRLRPAAAAGSLALLSLLAGYVVGAHIRGDASSSSLILFWGLAALLAGPALGVSAHLVRTAAAVPAAIGIGVLGGVLVGEGVYGLLRVAQTTYPPFWWGQIMIGSAVVAVTARRRLRRPGPIVVAVGTTATIAAAFPLIYGLDLIALVP